MMGEELVKGLMLQLSDRTFLTRYAPCLMADFLD